METHRNNSLIIDDAMKPNALQKFYILLVVVVVSPAEDDQSMLKGHLDLLWVTHQVFCVYVDSLEIQLCVKADTQI